MYWGSKYCVGCVRNRNCYCKANNTGDIICPIFEESVGKIFKEEYAKINKFELIFENKESESEN